MFDDLWTMEAALTGWSLLAALAGLGLIVGILTGLFGVGGGFMIVPLLNVLLGIPYQLAVGSSLSFIVGTSAGGLARHRRSGNVEARAVVLLGAGSIFGAIGGDALQDVMRASLGEHFTNVMHGLFVVLLVAVARLISRERPGHHSGLSPLQRFPIGPRATLPRASLPNVSATGLIGLGACVGVVTGVMGVGGGVLIVPALVAVVGLAPHLAVGTSLGVILLGASAGVIKKGLGEGKVSLALAMALLIGSSIGVQIGAAICDRLHAQRLRQTFAMLVYMVAVLVAAQLCRGLLGL
ncbi:MAG: sulfite exporter TauE/SafE family protein [Planctomycetota bacterium]|jgi:uncharacterized membrane protein YfcA